MYFKRLEIHGFKSFAEPVIVDFHPGITCVVGPNGSGKSNISDAIRWVLGEQSPKTLRGGKMEEVIFAGTSTRKSRGMAEVTLIIDNSDKKLNIDYNEVAITRRMYRSGESEYLINSHPCRLRDIRELIMDTGIGVDGYSIIGQGKISDIVSNKPESRREIFEEAAGIVMYKSKKAEAERKLESTSVNLARVNDIVTEIEERIGTLEEDSKKAKEYLELKEQFTFLEINIILKTVENMEKIADTYRNDIEKLKSDIDSITLDKYNAQRETFELRTKDETLEKDVARIKNDVLLLVEEIGELHSKESINRQRLSAIISEIEKDKSDIESIEKKIKEEETSLSEMSEKADSMSIALEKVRKDLQGEITEQESIIGDKIRLTEKIDASAENLFTLNNKQNSSISEYKSIETLMETLRKRKVEVVGLMEESRRKEKLLSEDLDKYRRILDDEKDKLDLSDKQINETKSKVSQLSSEYEKGLEKYNAQTLQMSKLESRKKTMEEMELNYEGYNFAVRSLMKANLNGIIDVAANLMKVKEGYEIALETAMGSSTQNIICEKDNDAKIGVRFLKNNNSGRLTFLPISSVKGRKVQLSDKITLNKGFLGIASDIIECEDKYKGIYDYLLGRVVIVSDMDRAVELSKEVSGVRFVTLEGEIINSSGSITGGSYKNKNANIFERKHEIEKLSSVIDSLNINNIQIKDRIKLIDDEKSKLLELIKSAEDGSWDIKKRILEISGIISNTETKLEDERHNSGKLQRESESIEEELLRTEETVKDLRNIAETAKVEISSLNTQVDEFNKQLVKINSDLDMRNESITAKRIDVNRYDSQKQAMDAICNRIKSQLTFLESEKSSRLANIGLLENEKISIERGKDGLSEDIAYKTSQKEEMEKEESRITHEREAISEKLKLYDDESARRELTLNASMEQKNQLEIKAARNEAQLESVKERLWDEFEVSYAQALDMKHENFSLAPAVKESRQLKNRIKDLGDVNVGAIKEYESVSSRLKFLIEQRADIISAEEELNNIIDMMDGTIKSRFHDNFDKVAVNFEETFKELFGGGYAELRMDNEEDPLNSGIDIIAQPPGKKLQNINLMSGGEKTMTAIALMFAVLKTKPTPFCILDEVEAALDDTNIHRFAAYLRNFENIQFTLITHQKETMEHADVLYGVTMAEHGISQLLSLKLSDEIKLG